MYGYIYVTKNLENGRLYVGQKKGKFNPNYYGSGLALKNALAKYGRKRFYIEVITECNIPEEMDERETYFIGLYSKNYGSLMYNIMLGGQKVRIFSKETLEKMKIANTGRKLSEETKKKMSNSHKGFVKTKEHLAKLVASRKSNGYKMSQEQKDAVSKLNKGRKQSAETIEKRVKKLTGQKRTDEFKEREYSFRFKKGAPGRVWTEEEKEKVRQKMLNRYFSPETRKKISENRKGKGLKSL